MTRRLLCPRGARVAWLVLAVFAVPAPVFGQTSGTWIAPSSGNWSASTNWSLTGLDAFPSNGGVATFGGAVFPPTTAGITVTQDVAGLTLSGISFTDTANPVTYT